MLLKGKTALITGGTAGIGKSIAFCFVRNGARVVILGTNEQRALETVNEINEQCNGKCASYKIADVSNTQKIEDIINQIYQEETNIDILVNNAGITKDNLLMKMSEKDWDDVINVNLKSAYNTCKPIIRKMMKARAGKIINITSVVGVCGNAGQTNYSASKAGLIGFTKSLAKEVSSRGVNVNCIAPGFIKTKMTDKLSEKVTEGLKQSIPMGRLGEPEDIAKAALFLSSDMSDYVTGQVLVVDGGMII
jgi:3-oxoacyl-[acyl-carrier protein] reductase